MGSKTPAKEKQDTTCDVCKVKFQSIQGLRSHIVAKHIGKEKSILYSNLSKTEKATPKNTPTVSASRTSKRIQLRKGEQTPALESGEKTKEEGKSTMGEEKKVVFNCPKCGKVFPIYFQALKHIQKKHCVDSEGLPVSPNSPDLIKPISTDMTPQGDVSKYICIACEKTYLTINEYNKHVLGLHHFNIDSLFFKTMEEFNLWKQQMETQVKIKHLILHKNWQQTYQCNYVSPRNGFNKTYLCPSLVVLKQLSHGYQVQYYKEHYGHKTPDYVVPPEFFGNLVKKVEMVFEAKEDSDDLYIKLQKVLNKVAIDAAKVNIPHLKKLFKTAQQMQEIINSYEEDDDKEPQMKSMTDDQISNVLEGKRTSARLKRKSETRSSIDSKKAKEDETVSKKTDEVKLEKTVLKKTDEVKLDKTVLKKTDEVKLDKTILKKSDEVKLGKTFKENVESSRPSARSSPLLSPSFNDSYKQFVEKTESKKPKKEVVKTRIGQFVPKSPENKPRVQVLKPSTINKVVKDVKYEVREQINDCNILVLKI